MEAMGAVGGVVVLVLGLLVLLIAVLWILMPFAIFGTKDLLRELIREQKKTNEILIGGKESSRTGWPPPRRRHDSLTLSEDWHPGQSFNGLARRSLTSISRDNAELAAQKVEAYAALWASGAELQ